MMANSRCVPSSQWLWSLYNQQILTRPPLSLSVLTINSKDKQLQNAMKSQQQQNAQDNGPAQAEYRELNQ